MKTMKIQSPTVSSLKRLFLKEVLKIKIIFVFFKNQTIVMQKLLYIIIKVKQIKLDI